MIHASDENGAAAAGLELRPAGPRVAEAEGNRPVAVTVRLSHTLYVRLKLAGARQRKTNQTVLVEALRAWLDKNS